MKRISALLTLLLLTNIPISCNWGCGSFTPLESKITDMTASVGVLDTAAKFSTVKSTDFREAAIEVMITNLDYSEIASIDETVRSSFLNAAYACSPPEPEPQAIESIDLTSEAPIFAKNRMFEAGESLNELFQVRNNSSHQETQSIADFIKFQQEYLYNFGYLGDFIIFQLKEKPDSVINQRILIDFEFSFGESISAESDNLNIDN
jgi:hypothetical protein